MVATFTSCDPGLNNNAPHWVLFLSPLSLEVPQCLPALGSPGFSLRRGACLPLGFWVLLPLIGCRPGKPTMKPCGYLTRLASGSAETTNGQFWTGTSQNTGVLPAGRLSIREVTTKRGIYLTPRCPGLGEVVRQCWLARTIRARYGYSGRRSYETKHFDEVSRE
jgi:hypothetical protein